MKIICVGRNYTEHIEELNNEKPKQPLLFIKPESSILNKEGNFLIPDFSNEIHHEVEIFLRICKKGKDIKEKEAHCFYDAVGLGIDFTARDIQSLCKEKGWSWEIAKGFDGATVISELVPSHTFQDIEDVSFALKKNNEIVQLGNTKKMLWKFDELITYISKYFTLNEGDLIFTGTPAGVSKVISGDELIGELEGKEFFKVKVI